MWTCSTVNCCRRTRVNTEKLVLQNELKRRACALRISEHCCYFLSVLLVCCSFIAHSSTRVNSLRRVKVLKSLACFDSSGAYRSVFPAGFNSEWWARVVFPIVASDNSCSCRASRAYNLVCLPLKESESVDCEIQTGVIVYRVLLSWAVASFISESHSNGYTVYFQSVGQVTKKGSITKELLKHCTCIKKRSNDFEL